MSNWRGKKSQRPEARGQKPEARRQKPAIKCWLLASGLWLLASGFWPLASGLVAELQPERDAVRPQVGRVELERRPGRAIQAARLLLTEVHRAINLIARPHQVA